MLWRPSSPTQIDSRRVDRRTISSMVTLETPRVSIVIPCFNAEATIVDQLKSIEDQDSAPAFEIVVVDNGSTDGTIRVVQEFADSSKIPVRLVCANEHQGASYARNVGIRMCQAERIMFCDADDIVSRWWVSHGEKSFEFSPVWSGSAILLSDTQFEGSIDQIRTEFGDSEIFEPPQTRQLDPFPVLMGGNFGATKTALVQVGGFDQSFFPAGEDNDLGFRFKYSGIQFMEAPSVRIGYRGKWDPTFIRRLAFRQAKAHALIATRYGAWDESKMPRMFKELVRISGSAVLMVLGLKSRDWLGLSSRAAVWGGLSLGKVKYKFLGLTPDSMIGEGLLVASSERKQCQ